MSVKIKGWPRGMNNIAADFELPAGSLRDAVNVDILDSGSLRRRQGATLRKAAANVHSLWSKNGTSLAVIDGSLVAINPSLSTTELRTGMGSQRVQYEYLNGEAYYTNPGACGKVVNGAAREWGVETPASAPTMAAQTGGALPAGTYQALCTYVNDRGEESACGFSSRATLSAAGVLTIGVPTPTSTEVQKVRVYLTAPDGDVFYEVAELDAGQTSVALSSSPFYGRACRTQFMVRTFPGELITYYNGRMYIAVGNVLWHTEAFALGLINPAKNYLQFASPITMIKAVEDGIYVATDETVFLSGSGPAEFQSVSVFPFGAAKYSAADFPDSTAVTWFSDRGIVVAGPGGQARLVQDGNVIPPKAGEAATIVRESNSVTQIISAVSGNAEVSSLSASDFMDAEIIRKRGS